MSNLLCQNQSQYLLNYLLSSFQSPSFDLLILFVNLTYSGDANDFNLMLMADKPLMLRLIYLVQMGPLAHRQFACWILINILQNPRVYQIRLKILKETDFLPAMLALLHQSSEIKKRTRALEIVSTAIRGIQVLTQPFPKQEVNYQQFMEEVVQTMAEFLFQDHAQILTYSTKILKQYSGINPEAMSHLVHKRGLLPVLIEKGLQYSRRCCFLSAFQTIGNLLSAEYVPLERELFFQLQFIEVFNSLMKKFSLYKDTSMLVEGLWVLTNLPIQDRELFKEACRVFHWAVQYMNSEVHTLRLHSIQAIQNFLFYCEDYQTLEFVNQGLIQGLRTLLTTKDVNTLQLTLACLDQLLNRGDKLVLSGKLDQNGFWEEFKKLGGQTQLKKFRLHSVDKIFKSSERILKRHGERERKEEEDRIEI